MRDEIETIPAVIEAQVSRLRPVLRDLAERLGSEVGEIVVTGCGDSFYAGMATRQAIQAATGLRASATEALEFARYDLDELSTRARSVLVAVSYSGEVGRTIEAATMARERGWRTVALTGRLDGRLAGRVEDPVAMEVPTLGFSPGTSTYVAMISALLVLGAELAIVRGRAEAAGLVYDALTRSPELARRTLEASEIGALQAAELLAVAPTSTFLGAGPSRATAAFGAAKLLEGPQRYGAFQDLEEWAHEQYFISGPATPIVVVAPAGASRDRAGELLAEMAFIGAPAIFVSDVVDDAIALRAPIRLPVGRGLEESFSPIVSCLPLASAAFFVAERLGTSSYGFPSPEHEREHYDTIHRATRGESTIDAPPEPVSRKATRP